MLWLTLLSEFSPCVSKLWAVDAKLIEPLKFNFSVFLFYTYTLLHLKWNSLKMKLSKFKDGWIGHKNE